jgi:hypothetical protein
MSNPRTRLPSRLPPPEPRKGSPWLLVSVVGGCVVMSIMVIGGLLLFGPTPPPPPAVTAQSEAPPVAAKTDALEAKIAESKTSESSDTSSALVEDDGKTLWASPTNGRPLDLSYLPPGCQIIISIRIGEISQQKGGLSALLSLGPGIEIVKKVHAHIMESRSFWTQSDAMTIGLQVDAQGAWLMTRVVELGEPMPEMRKREYKTLFENQVHEYQGAWYGVSEDYAYYLVPSADRVVIAPKSQIREIIDLAGNPPPLRRDIERLVENTDVQRQLTVLFAPASLFSIGPHIFTGEFARLQEPLSWFLGDELSAVGFSAHLDSNLFLEVIAVPTLETSTEKTSQFLVERVSQIPDRIEQYVVNLNAQPYGRLVIARFPEMLRKLVAYTRSGFDRSHATLRCYLPAVAAHNLLLATELTLAEQPGASRLTSTAPNSTDTTSPIASASIEDRLAKVTSLKFARDTLESALDQLSQDIGATIVIRGPDLQADGITKNQSFAIDLADKPASEILVEILRLANPDKLATGANDKRQKLVYIIEAKPDKTEQIVVTTRAKAMERKDELPAPFRVEKP